MTDRNITLVEYHSHGGGPGVLSDLFGGPRDPEGAEGRADEPSEDDRSGRGLGILLVLAILVGIAVGYRYLSAEEEPSEFETEQVEVTEYEN